MLAISDVCSRNAHVTACDCSFAFHATKFNNSLPNILNSPPYLSNELIMGRSLIAILSIFSFILYAVRAVLSGLILNDTFNGEPVIGEEQNQVSFWLTLATIINSMIGLAAAVAGILHYMEWNSASRFGTVVGVAVVAMLDLFILGLAAKQWQVGGDMLPDGLGARETMLGALAVIATTSTSAFLVSALFSDVSDEETEDLKQPSGSSA